jgi:hypothetical protein
MRFEFVREISKSTNKVKYCVFQVRNGFKFQLGYVDDYVILNSDVVLIKRMETYALLYNGAVYDILTTSLFVIKQATVFKDTFVDLVFDNGYEQRLWIN